LAFLLLTMMFTSAYSQGGNDAFSVQATVSTGVIEGNYHTKTGIQTYFGIPFAQPPVGDLRWKAPVPVAENWEGVKGDQKIWSQTHATGGISGT
jgi:para-nitrobenzyl esterase